MTDRLRDKVQALGRRLPQVDPPPVPAVRHRSTAIRHLTRGGQAALIGSLAVILLLSLGGLLSLGREPASTVSTAPPATLDQPTGSALPFGGLPLTATVTCAASGASTETLEVAPQLDGVHIVVENVSGEAMIAQIAGVQSFSAPTGETRLVPLQVGPGTLSVSCVSTDPALPPGQSEVALITVVDPSDLWKSRDLTCENRISRAILFPDSEEGAQGDPLEIATTEWGKLAADVDIEFPLPGDVIERAGYPEGPEFLVRATRGERVIASALLGPVASGGWLIQDASLCSE